MIKNEIELASKILQSDSSEDARALAAHYMPLPFALEDALRELEYFVECTLATISRLITLSNEQTGAAVMSPEMAVNTLTLKTCTKLSYITPKRKLT